MSPPCHIKQLSKTRIKIPIFCMKLETPQFPPLNADPVGASPTSAPEYCLPRSRGVPTVIKHAAQALLVLAVGILPTLADTLYGSVTFKDKSKDRGTTAISTSWNSAKGKSNGKGKYTLDFGGKVGKKITVYVNGKRYAEVLVKGDTELDIVVPD